MTFFDKLTSIVRISAPKLKILKLIGLKILSENTINITIKKNDNRQIVIPPDELKKLIKASLEEKYLIIDESAQKRIEDFSSVNSTIIFQSTYDFFKGKIPSSDLEILRASLYVKTVYERGESVNDLKWQIMQKYGVRGKNIVNLCTAGYFDSIIKPLYGEMLKRAGFTPEDFTSTYNKIIEHYTFAVFVSSRMTKDELKKEITSKIEDNKKYGVKSMNIHGLGEENVKKIVEVLSELKDLIKETPEINSRIDYIIVKISI